MDTDIQIVVPKKGDVLRDCARRLLVFCAVDAYFGYDVEGRGTPPDPPEVITPRQVRAANAEMKAFTFTSDWRKQELLEVPLPELEPSVLPEAADLVDMSDGEWEQTRPLLRRLYERVIRPRPGVNHRIRAVAATKVLHLKRPGLVAIVDSYVARYLKCQRPDPVDEALAVADAVRAIGRHGENPAALGACAEYLLAHPLDGHCPRLTKARMLDALLWMKAMERYSRLWQALGWSPL